MDTRQNSRQARFDRLPTFYLVAAALTSGVAACSSADESSTAAPALSPVAPNTPSDMPSAASPTSPDPAGGAPAASPSEGIPNVATLEPATEPGSAGPVAPEPPLAMAPDGGTAAPAVPSAGCGQARTLEDGVQSIASGGMNRTYFLETPDAYDATQPHRVVFMFHWNYGSIEAIVNPPDADRNTDEPFYGMGDLAGDDTIFVVPQGLVDGGGGAGWANPNNRDVSFTDDLLAAVSADLCIDTSRVFTTGFSYGAGMSVALACVRPDNFRAAVVYNPAFISGVNAAQCARPVALFESHGVDDQIINYQTGLNVLNTFVGLNGCTAMTPPEPPTDGHLCTSYANCSVPTRFCSFGAGENNPFNPSLRGHYPTAKDPGETRSWIPAEAWSFISQF
jgi:poly(3-hydroxybutyrate) depolymerase